MDGLMQVMIYTMVHLQLFMLVILMIASTCSGNLDIYNCTTEHGSTLYVGMAQEARYMEKKYPYDMIAL